VVQNGPPRTRRDGPDRACRTACRGARAAEGRDDEQSRDEHDVLRDELARQGEGERVAVTVGEGRVDQEHREGAEQVHDLRRGDPWHEEPERDEQAGHDLEDAHGDDGLRLGQERHHRGDELAHRAQPGDLERAERDVDEREREPQHGDADASEHVENALLGAQHPRPGRSMR
jgi:hypothetical protein